ncbi:MAG: hemerythrin domain-containing protein [Deltaproteobacteria bacterium]|nr:hemerythrin domain-containing protein [Deltaproteobacteria bacterium]
MKPRGPLMIEHRLIEKMIDLIRRKIPEFRTAGQVAPGFLEAVVDFMRFYTDGTHHGKEEDIYFRDCAGKPLTKSERALMEELIEEHALSRKALDEISQANEQSLKGVDVLETILEKLQAWIEIYPRHIDKEDKHFFPAMEKYFSEQEERTMLQEFDDFDKKQIQVKYRSLVTALQQG